MIGNRPIVLLLLLAAADGIKAAEPPSYGRDVRQILSKNCFRCHGPDEGERKAKMRLDVPGDTDWDEVIRRISSSDLDERMPPPESKKSLTDGQIETLNRWIAEGANYEEHWAFVPPEKAAVPDGVHPVDFFVRQKLSEQNLKPSPEADRSTLVRRLYLDLIGLPPTPEETDWFVNDASSNAYANLVERLLKSPHYGERWGRRWLDLARYADTNGYEKDRDRTIWPYRDWVIRAINDDMPFDQFTIEQLAGDMLPDATREQRVATGFHRNTMLNEEGGIDPLEFRFHAMTDRVATTGTAFLGLTLGCAQCHTHKYDPITHTEYYGLFAYLNNADEPEMDLPETAAADKYKADLEEADRLLAELPSRWPLDENREWEAVSPSLWTTTSGNSPKLLEDKSLLYPVPGPDLDVYTITFETRGRAIDKLRLDMLTHESLPNNGPGRVDHGNFVLSEIEIQAAALDPEAGTGAAKPEKIVIVGAVADIEQPGFEVLKAFDGKGSTGWGVHDPSKPLNRDRHAIFSFEEPVGFEEGTRFTVVLRQNLGDQHTIGRLRFSIPGPLVVNNQQESTETQRERAINEAFAAWREAARQGNAAWNIIRPERMTSNLPLLEQQPDGSVFVSGDNTKHDTYRLTFANPGTVTAIRLEALPDARLPDYGPGTTFYEGRKGDFFLSEFQVTADGSMVKIADATETYSKNRFGNSPVTARLATDDDFQTGWSVSGRVGERHVAVFNLDKPISAGTKSLEIRMDFGRHYSSSLGRFRISVTGDKKEVRASDLSNEVTDILMATESDTTPPEKKVLLDAFLLQAPEVAGPAKRIEELRRRPQHLRTLVMQERPPANLRPTHRHHRGEFLSPREAVHPILPEALWPRDRKPPANRLGFARWVVSSENPLTARVVVNRHWAALFGRGIVPTLNDFGMQGELPSHPELLDYLAFEFMEEGWSLKKLHRLLVTSATYRQQSVVKGRESDMRWLVRAPRFRLEAEMIRDSALTAAGLLSEKMFGPPVRPPQPPGVTEVAYGSPRWKPSEGEERYRRSIYTYLKRTAPFAMFTTFDAPSGEACTARRDVSNTPLQALTLMNDPMLIEISQAMGKEFAGRSGETAKNIELLFRRILTRPPDGSEMVSLLSFFQKQKSKSGDAVKAWSAVARALLSLDETITRN